MKARQRFHRETGRTVARAIERATFNKVRDRKRYGKVVAKKLIPIEGMREYREAKHGFMEHRVPVSSPNIQHRGNLLHKNNA